jgi:hypothetical protein
MIPKVIAVTAPPTQSTGVVAEQQPDAPTDQEQRPQVRPLADA